MRQRKRAWRLGPGLLAIAGAATGGCAPAADPRSVELSLEQLGERLFTEETFDGNGRVCSTCHELDQFGTITPEFVQELYETDQEAALFRVIESDDGFGESYARLREHATVRVRIETAIDDSTGLSIRKCDAPEETTVVLHRGVPSVFNVGLEQALMLDGREDDDLEMQALNAIRAHSAPGREPTPDELAAELAQALAESFTYCDEEYAISDEDAAATVEFFGNTWTRLGVLAANAAHDAEHYGNLVTYMRINGIVPPSSER